MNHCPRCKKDKDIEQFQSKFKGKGLNTCCKDCLQLRYKFRDKNKEYDSIWKKKNRDKIKGYSQRYYDKHFRKSSNPRLNFTEGEIKKYIDEYINSVILKKLREENKDIIKEHLSKISFNPIIL